MTRLPRGGRSMKQSFTRDQLQHQAAVYLGTGGVSAENRQFGFRPAFLNRESGECALSCDACGAPAAIHQFDGVPESWVALRDASGRPVAHKSSVVSGYMRDGQFFTRDHAAQMVQWELDKAALCAQRCSSVLGSRYRLRNLGNFRFVLCAVIAHHLIRPADGAYR